MPEKGPRRGDYQGYQATSLGNGALQVGLKNPDGTVSIKTTLASIARKQFKQQYEFKPRIPELPINKGTFVLAGVTAGGIAGLMGATLLFSSYYERANDFSHRKFVEASLSNEGIRDQLNNVLGNNVITGIDCADPTSTSAANYTMPYGKIVVLGHEIDIEKDGFTVDGQKGINNQEITSKNRGPNDYYQQVTMAQFENNLNPDHPRVVINSGCSLTP